MKYQKVVTVKNPFGLHVRPATEIAKLIKESKSTVFLSHNQQTINGNSIMSILLLSASKNAQVTVVAEGEDAEVTLERIVSVIEHSTGDCPP